MSPNPIYTASLARRAFLVAALVVAAAAVPAAAVTAGADAAHPSEGPSFVVVLQDDGDARVALTLTYDLETDDEREAFRTLQNDSETRADVREQFRSRMAAVADDAGNATGREMSVTDAAIDVSTSGDGHVGVVELGVTWTSLASVEDGRLVVTEPFASGFESDRPVTLRGPDGYQRTDASPAPDARGSNAATWKAGTDLSGFEVTFAPAGGDGGGPTTSDGGAGDGESGGSGVNVPGFGAVAGLVALAAAALALTRRR